jgi:hypothetical protein
MSSGVLEPPVPVGGYISRNVGVLSSGIPMLCQSKGLSMVRTYSRRMRYSGAAECRVLGLRKRLQRNLCPVLAPILVHDSDGRAYRPARPLPCSAKEDHHIKITHTFARDHISTTVASQRADEDHRLKRLMRTSWPDKADIHNHERTRHQVCCGKGCPDLRSRRFRRAAASLPTIPDLQRRAGTPSVRAPA